MAVSHPVASMTGFARREGGNERATWAWEVKSVNGRSLDLRCRMPPGHESLEARARAAITDHCARGNVNLTLTVQRALAEVEDSLAGIRTFRDELSSRERQVTSARSAATLSRARYDGGVTSYLEVLDSERSLFDAELAESIARRESLTSIVQLYKALGGGWEPPPPTSI